MASDGTGRSRKFHDATLLQVSRHYFTLTLQRLAQRLRRRHIVVQDNVRNHSNTRIDYYQEPVESRKFAGGCR